MFTKATLVDCGPFEVEFFNESVEETTLDTELFFDDRHNVFGYDFITLRTYDEDKTGIHPMNYRVFHTDYPSNVVTPDEPFIVTIVNPCDDYTKTLTVPSLDDQEYTITDTPVTYKISAFIYNPTWCRIVYSYTISESAVEAVVAFNDDP